MATLSLINPTFFTNGSVTQDSKVIGYDDEGRKKHVVRYSFTAPSIGMHTFSVTKTNLGVGSDNKDITFGFYITTDANSYAQADQSYTHFPLVKTSTSLSGSCDFTLLPNTTYYVWFFPTKTLSYGWYYWNYPNDISASGADGAGITKIYIDGQWKNALTYIYTDSGWKIAMPWIYTSNGWKNTC